MIVENAGERRSTSLLRASQRQSSRRLIGPQLNYTILAVTVLKKFLFGDQLPDNYAAILSHT